MIYLATVEKRGRGYRIRVPRGTDANGKRQFYTKIWQPPEGMSERKIQKELEVIKVQFEQQCKNGEVSIEANLKLKEFCETYLEFKRDVLQPRTYEAYENEIRDLIIPNLGNIRLSELKPLHVQKYVQYVAGIKKRDGSSISPNTVKRKLACLQSILRQAVKLQIIKESPADAKFLSLPKCTSTEVTVFQKDSMAEMLQCLETEPIELQAAVQIAFATGARLGEIVGLKFSDFDYNKNRVTIQRSAYKVKGKPVEVKLPKDNDIRTVAIYQEVIDLVRLLHNEKVKQAEKLGTAWIEDDWLFTKWNGLIMHPQTLSKQFSKFLKRNNITHHKFHSLRHTSATLLLDSGVNVRQVQARLGHGSLKTTQNYLHCLQEADEKAAAALQDLIHTH